MSFPIDLLNVPLKTKSIFDWQVWISESQERMTLATQIAKELSLPPIKLHCSMLAEDATKKKNTVEAKMRVLSFALSSPWLAKATKKQKSDEKKQREAESFSP